MGAHDTVPALTVGLVLFALAAGATDDQLRFFEQIEVFGKEPVVIPVGDARRIEVNFKAGDLDVVAQDLEVVRTELQVRCRELSDELCSRYQQRLRLVAQVEDETLSVRLVGLSLLKMRKVGVTGRVIVPSHLPLDVKMGFGDLDVDVKEATGDVRIGMRVGDLEVHANHRDVSSVGIDTRIGDASLEDLGAHLDGERRKLIGSHLFWQGDQGPTRIQVALRIGDASVVLE